VWTHSSSRAQRPYLTLMSRLSCLRLLAAVALLGAGCDKVRDTVCEPVKVAAIKAATQAAAKKAAALAQGKPAPEAPASAAEPEEAAGPESALLTAAAQRGFALPFAWEKSPEEPLAKARKFLREVADDNTSYVAKGPEFFKTFAAAQHPRATVVTCADARVQAGAFDATPENDDFSVRNIGNQVGSSLGSIQYGIEHLHTPVLLILGHTGCDAIKAALGDTRDLPEAMRHELGTLHAGKHADKKDADDHQLLVAVLANVHDQVKVALHEFGPRVNAGDLTIVGAVYDFRNELGKGAGRLSVINVNGNQDPVRLKSFVEAIMSGPGAGKTEDDAMARLARALADPGPPSEDQDLDDAVGR
jgi:carbonic anhydrase